MKNKTPFHVVVLAGLAFGGAFAAARPAQAREHYPESLQTGFNMPCVPRCTLCHATIQGGGPPATQLGVFVITKGANIPGPQLVENITTGLNDADTDGVLDMEELKQGTDPNVAGATSLCGPTYGCGARVARAPLDPDAAAAAAAAVTALLGAFALRRRRGQL